MVDEMNVNESSQPEPVEAAESEAVETNSSAEEEPKTAEVESSPESKPVEAEPVAPEKPRRWLILKATAVLASVAATNYVCYGGGPVVPLGTSELSAPPADPARLSLALALRDSEGHTRLACPNLDMKNHELSVRQSVWSGYDRERRLQVLWVWDFFRIQSHIALRVALPHEDGATVEDRWQEMIETARTLEPGSRIDIEVQSACGDIMQQHVLADPAAEWVPG
jgi:hypothetical protein